MLAQAGGRLVPPKMLKKFLDRFSCSVGKSWIHLKHEIKLTNRLVQRSVLVELDMAARVKVLGGRKVFLIDRFGSPRLQAAAFFFEGWQR